MRDGVDSGSSRVGDSRHGSGIFVARSAVEQNIGIFKSHRVRVADAAVSVFHFFIIKVKGESLRGN